MFIGFVVCDNMLILLACIHGIGVAYGLGRYL